MRLVMGHSCAFPLSWGKIKVTGRWAPSFITFPSVLLLNATYEPLQVVSWQKAMILWFQQKVDIVESHERVIRSVSHQIPAPAVLKLRKYIRPRVNKRVQLSRENIFIRDNYTCQYCEVRLPYRDLTLDHVLPVSRGGRKSWENLVAACRECNSKKGNRTPKEANMKLLNDPVPMKWKPVFEVQIKLKDVDKLWSPYLKPAQAI